MRQGLSAIGPTPAERRVDEGGPAPDLARAFVPLAEMLPGSGFVTGVEKGGTEGGIDFLAELIGITTGAIGSVAGPPGAAIGYTGGKGAVKGLRSLLKKEVSEELIPQRLFHGTSNPDIKKFKSSKEGVLGEGVYLTPDPKYASTYATGDTANVIPVSAKIKKPLVVQSTGAEPSTDVLKALGVPEDKAFRITEEAFDNKGNITKEISTRARKQGYDAVVFKNKDGDIQEIVSYKPDNISSSIGKETEEVTSFSTSRGKNPSLYTWDGRSTQRIHRSPDDHSDKTTATQPKSGRTIFLDKKNAETVTKFFSSVGEDITIVPTSKNTAKIIRNKDYGPKKAGEVAEVKFSSQPEVGLHPFEMASNRSPPERDMRFYKITDESGKKVLGGQHMGTPITKIEKTPITKKRKGGSVIERNPYGYPPKAI